MISLRLHATAEAASPFIARLSGSSGGSSEARLVETCGEDSVFASEKGVFSISGLPANDLAGDVILVDPIAGWAERLLRAGSLHNTLLVTERCDQLCLMCSQPPKKTHVDRFDLLESACLLAEPSAFIGITGGEPTLYKTRLLQLLERVLAERPDISFHVLTNGQHFEKEDVERLRQPSYRSVQWGIPLYADEAALHDEIVGKVGAHERLEMSLAYLMQAGAGVELRTVVLTRNVHVLPRLARRIASRLSFIDAWSIMQLERIGFARNRWSDLYFDHKQEFGPIGEALDVAVAFGIAARLFNFARCTVPVAYRSLAAASISDWKKRFAPGCEGCRERELCAGFFEWHPDGEEVTPL